ncbi:endonuclease V [Candidatus Pacearchaeota archaeon ex4484_26]|nr:MAG: endonuclease V [Candidatus Pacearchaeota archaeon ex4484_26]
MLKKEELIKRFNINIKALEQEQEKLAKLVIEKDKINFENLHFIGGVDATTAAKEIIGSAAIINPDFEVIEQKYSTKKASFPYLSGFLAYRELPALISAYKKLETKPDVVFVSGHGVLHPRYCGLASHFGLATDSITIGVAKDLLVGEVKKDKVYLNGKVKGMLVETKKASKPIVVSVGHNISLATAVELTKKFSREPHKFPEPLTQAHKYANSIKNELRRKVKLI